MVSVAGKYASSGKYAARLKICPHFAVEQEIRLILLLPKGRKWKHHPMFIVALANHVCCLSCLALPPEDVQLCNVVLHGKPSIDV